MDDLRIYNKALTAAQVAQLYGADTTLNAPQVKKVTNGLVGYWSFNNPDMNWATGQAVDKSGQGNHGALVNLSTTTSPTIGKSGQALSFNGTSQAVQTGNVASPSSITATAWIKATNFHDWEPIVGQWNENANQRSWAVALSSTGQISAFNSTNGNLSSQSISNTALSLNKWYFVTVVQDTSNASTGKKIYINGVLDASSAQSGIFSLSQPITIGYSPMFAGGQNYFAGAIDEVRVYSRALSAAEVKQLYNAGK
jgi:hypothetical protein